MPVLGGKLAGGTNRIISAEEYVYFLFVIPLMIFKRAEEKHVELAA